MYTTPSGATPYGGARVAVRRGFTGHEVMAAGIIMALAIATAVLAMQRVFLVLDLAG